MGSIIIQQHQYLEAEISVPGSKYIANRIIVVAALANGQSLIKGCPLNHDIKTALIAIEQLGAQVDYDKDLLKITGVSEDKFANEREVYCADSGTLSRFITAVAASFESSVTIDASQQMRGRPMQELIDGLKQAGVEVKSNDGYLPITVEGPIKGGALEVDASRSSQFLSGFLIACQKAKSSTVITLPSEPVSQSYLQMTIDAIEQFSGRVERINSRQYSIPSGQNLQANNLEIPADIVSSSYFMAAALIAKSAITISNFDFDSQQGEGQFYKVLESMGAKVEVKQQALKVSYQTELQGITVDMSDQPDVVPTLAAIACFARGTTRIFNIAHLAYKESNRIDDLCKQLIRLGADCQYDSDSITITGSKLLNVCSVSSCHDHRLAMSLALIGIVYPGLIIEQAQAVEKSFPDYWQYLNQLGITNKAIENG